MAHSSEFHNYVINDLMGQIPGITSRAMFGGYGIYKNGKIFAIIADDILYFKVNSNNRLDYEKYGSHPFTYISPSGKKQTMSYWELPAEILENPSEIENWIEKSLAL